MPEEEEPVTEGEAVAGEAGSAAAVAVGEEFLVVVVLRSVS